MAAINNGFFIPNVEEYFNGLIRLFHQCEEDVNNEGMPEYYCRRLEEYQRTLRVIYARLLEPDLKFCHAHGRSSILQ